MVEFDNFSITAIYIATFKIRISLNGIWTKQNFRDLCDETIIFTSRWKLHKSRFHSWIYYLYICVYFIHLFIFRMRTGQTNYPHFASFIRSFIISFIRLFITSFITSKIYNWVPDWWPSLRTLSQCSTDNRSQRWAGYRRVGVGWVGQDGSAVYIDVRTGHRLAD